MRAILISTCLTLTLLGAGSSLFASGAPETQLCEAAQPVATRATFLAPKDAVAQLCDFFQGLRDTAYLPNRASRNAFKEAFDPQAVGSFLMGLLGRCEENKATIRILQEKLARIAPKEELDFSDEYSWESILNDFERPQWCGASTVIRASELEGVVEDTLKAKGQVIYDAVLKRCKALYQERSEKLIQELFRQEMRRAVWAELADECAKDLIPVLQKALEEAKEHEGKEAKHEGATCPAAASADQGLALHLPSGVKQENGE